MSERRVAQLCLGLGFLATLCLGLPHLVWADEAAGLQAIREANTRLAVDHLASDGLEGRLAGTRGALLASEWLAAELDAIGIPAPSTGRMQDFGGGMRNVLGEIPGREPGEAIVIGAHLDHIGPGNGIYNGADDNASGCAVVLEIARAFKASGFQPRRAVVFAFFDGEEQGKLGSKHYVSVRSDTVLMINFDMVGRIYRRTLRLSGGGTSPRLAGWVDHASAGVPRLRIKRLRHVSSSSDHAAFHAHGVPVLMNSTGSHNDYHQPSDEADTIDHRGIVAIAKLGFLIAAQAAEDIADLSADVDPSKDSARESADALGIVPSATALRSGLLGGLRTR